MKPGIKTTEFWTTIISQALAVLTLGVLVLLVIAILWAVHRLNGRRRAGPRQRRGA